MTARFALLLLAYVSLSPADTHAAAAGRIVNLYDAFGTAPEGTTHDFGFSAYVEYRGQKILFDAGTDANILRENARALGVDLAQIDFAVGSHSHADHISGFDHLLELNPDVRIYLPHDFFGGAAPIRIGIEGTDPAVVDDLPADLRYFDGERTHADIHPSGRFWNADVQYVRESVEIADGVTLVATRSPFMGFYSRYPNLGVDGEPNDGDVNFNELPELSLALETDSGSVLLVGCSHSTIERIARATIAETERPVALAMGGYHLLPYGAGELEALAVRLKDELGVARVAPAHCTGPLGFKTLLEHYGDDFVRAGLGSIIEF